jgi:hypothetical protein
LFGFVKKVFMLLSADTLTCPILVAEVYPRPRSEVLFAEQLETVRSEFPLKLTVLLDEHTS